MNRFLLAFLLGLSLCLPAQAEQMQQLGAWDVHYIAFPAPLITAEIAQQYRLQRSKYNGIVNISVLDSSSKQAQKVTISGVAKDLQGRQRKLEFSEVIEGDAVYYLAQLPFRHEQRFSFTFTISNGNQSQQLKFDQTFYVD
ncbi:DUF4426 domain-containing protein [Rheinheimera maricola]|uniref:DUF4426 domain-containing protein n=1 Tax=Rheinheimera maricola TaxID=2793282 RepID=A0ABS7XB09_9GAMM|nr:DUF4426 domain-containing protein [Rheinheimera maricola]MBZ9611952.1 DUF4426 domain-containing protein [Rheinheimera maricola]